MTEWFRVKHTRKRRVERPTQQLRILAAVQRQPQTPKQLVYRNPEVSYALHAWTGLCDDGYLTRHGVGKGVRYSITEAGVELLFLLQSQIESS